MDTPFADNTLPAQQSPVFANAAEVTPDDKADLPAVSRAIFVGMHGCLAVQMPNGETVRFHNVDGGSLWPIAAKRILKTDTTATALVALW